MTNKISLKKEGGKIQVDVLTFKEDKYFIAFIPALNISSHSTDEKKAVKQLDSAIKLFFDHWVKSGKLDEKLNSLGWTAQPNKQLKPSENNIHIPLSLLGKEVSRRQKQIPAYC